MAEREEQVQAKMLQERIARDMAQTSAAAQSAMIDDQLQRTIKATLCSVAIPIVNPAFAPPLQISCHLPLYLYQANSPK